MNSSSESVTRRKDCPYDDCDWDFVYEVSEDVDEIMAEGKAERHFEREHLGEVRVTVTLDTTTSIHPGEEPCDVADRLLDAVEKRTPLSYGLEAAYARAEVLEEPDGGSDE